MASRTFPGLPPREQAGASRGNIPEFRFYYHDLKEGGVLLLGVEHMFKVGYLQLQVWPFAIWCVSLLRRPVA
ncbi:hypothetical protein CYG48_13155 [Neorhizobium sp. SOG26]|nr:hypothetical protein CYG48_13155 [Neorhizobium sp. SOG26]